MKPLRIIADSTGQIERGEKNVALRTSVQSAGALDLAAAELVDGI